MSWGYRYDVLGYPGLFSYSDHQKSAVRTVLYIFRNRLKNGYTSLHYHASILYSD